MAGKERQLSKLRVEHGASKITWVQLKTNIEESIATEIGPALRMGWRMTAATSSTNYCASD